MRTTRDRALQLVVGLRDRLFEAGVTPTADLKIERGEDWEVLVNMSQPCAGNNKRGVCVRKLDGEPVCERFSWVELRWAVAKSEAGR